MLTKQRKSRPVSTAAVEDHTEAAFRALIRTFGLVRRAMEPHFSRFGISGSQWAILRNLSCSESNGVKSLRLTDLSERLLIRPPSVTGVVDRLERQGLVERSGEAGDLRVKRVGLTDQGRALVQQVKEKHRAQIHSVLGALSAGEQKELHRLLDRLGAHLETIAGPAHIESGGKRI